MRNRVVNMSTLVLLSVGAGYIYSVGATFLFPGPQFYEAVSMSGSTVLVAVNALLLKRLRLSRAETAAAPVAPAVAEH